MASPLDDLNRPVTGNTPEPTNDPADVIAPELAETTEPEPSQQQQQPEIPNGDLRDEANNRWAQFRERIKNSQKKLKGDVGGSPTAQATEQVGKKVVQNVEKQAVKKVAATASRQVASKAATSAAVAAAPEIGAGILVAVGVGLVVIIILVIIFAIFGIGGSGSGGGLPQYPSSQEEKYAAVKLLSLSGDPQAKAEVITNEANALKKTLAEAKKNAASKLKEPKLSAATVAIDEAVGLLDQIITLASNNEGRTPLINQLNEKLVAIQKDYPDLFLSAGSCADLKPFIDSKQFIVGSGPNAKNIVEGKMATKVNGISPASQDLCGVLVYALRAGFKIYTGTLSYGHSLRSSNGRVSAHSCGAAIDIGRINGELVRSNSEETKKFLEVIRQGHSDKKIVIRQLISPFKELYVGRGVFGSYTDNDHDDHIHLSGRPVNPKCMETGKP